MPHKNMTNNFKKNQSGVTLVETMVSISIGVLITTMVIAITVGGLQHMQDLRNEARLHSNAIFLTDTLTYWVKKGIVLEVSGSDPSSLSITLPDDSTAVMRKDEASILLNDTPITTDDIEVRELIFVPLAHSVQMSFTLGIPDSDKTFSATTSVAQRNF